MAVSVNLPGSIKVLNPFPLDYWKGPWASVAAAKAGVPIGARFDGLTVKITGLGEYWWLAADLTDTGLVPKAINNQTQAQNLVFAGPSSGVDALPTFRALVLNDIPTLSSLYLPIAGGTLTGNLILNADPIAGLGAATKNYVDSFAASLVWKNVVDLATTGDITLSGEQTIDGVLTSTSDVLVWQQADATENGIYTSAAGAWSRRADSDTGVEIVGSAVPILSGTLYNNKKFVYVGAASITIGVDDINYTLFDSGSVYTNGAGLDLTGNIFSVDSTVALRSDLSSWLTGTLTGDVYVDGGTNSFTITNVLGFTASGIDTSNYINFNNGGSTSIGGVVDVTIFANSAGRVNITASAITLLNVKLTPQPTSSRSGVNLGSIAGDVTSGLVDGDVWYNSTTDLFKGRMNAVTRVFSFIDATETLTNKTLTTPTITSPVINTSISGTVTSGGNISSTNFLIGASATQTNSGAKTFLDATLLMRNVANTFSSRFTNTNTGARIYTLPDTNGRLFVLDNVGPQTSSAGTSIQQTGNAFFALDNYSATTPASLDQFSFGSGTFAGLRIESNEAVIGDQALNLTINTGQFYLQSSPDAFVTQSNSIDIQNGNFTYGDNKVSPNGIKYATSGYVTHNRSLTDKEYVDSNDAISELKAASSTNSIDNLNYKQTWNFSTLADDVALELISTSTLANSNSQLGMRVVLNGANANSAQTTTAFAAVNQHTGTTSTNVAGIFTASGGSTANYSLILTGDIRLENTNTLISASDGIGRTVTFLPGTDVVGINVGSTTANPTSPSNGGIYYNSTANELRARINGAWVALGAGGGGGITNGAAANELMVSDGTNAIGTKIYSSSDGNLILGNSSLAGANRLITIDSSVGTADLMLEGLSTGYVYVTGGRFAVNNSRVSLFTNISINSTTSLMRIFGTYWNSSATAQYFEILGADGIAGLTSGQHMYIKAGNGYASGNTNGGHLYLDSGVKNASGLTGNIGLFESNLANWQNMEGGIYIKNRVTSPTSGLLNGVAFYAKDSNSSSELYTFTESGAEVNISGLLEPVTESGTSFSLNETHRNKIVLCTNSAAITVTVGTGKAAGWNCLLLATHATGTISLSASGTTLNGTTATTTQFETLSIVHYGSEVYLSKLG